MILGKFKYEHFVISLNTNILFSENGNRIKGIYRLEQPYANYRQIDR